MMGRRPIQTHSRRRAGRVLAGCVALAALLPCAAQTPSETSLSGTEIAPPSTLGDSTLAPLTLGSETRLPLTPARLATLPTRVPLLRAGFGSFTPPRVLRAMPAPEPTVREVFRAAPLGGSRRFIDRELLPTVDRYLHRAAAVDLGAPHTASIFDHVYYEELHRQSQRGLQRGCEKALQEMLLREATLDQVVDRVEAKVAERDARKDPGRTRFRLEVGGLRPELGIKQRLPYGQMRMRLTLDGDVRFDFADTRIGRNFRIGCTLSPEQDRYTFGGHFGF